MSTTDKPTWLLAERFRDVPAIEEAITNFAHDQTGDNATGIVLAVLAHQAATEAAKATGTAAPDTDIFDLIREWAALPEGQRYNAARAIIGSVNRSYSAGVADGKALGEAVRQPAPVAAQENAPAELPPLPRPGDDDARFMAAANPAAILELIALAERTTQPGQDQPAAVRAAIAPTPIQQVPTAWCTDAHFEAWCERHDMRKDHSDHRQMFDDAASLYLTVPSPQPELGGSIDTPKFRQRLRGLRNYTLQESMDIELNEICEAIDAWKDAACAAAIENVQAEVVTWKRYAEGVEKRATDAEAKLAAIQSQAAGGKMDCPSCGKDRLKEPCPNHHEDCPMVADAHLMTGETAMREQQP